MKTVIEVLKLSADYLQQRNVANARRQAEEIIADALGIERVDLYMQFDRPLTESELETCRARLARRAKGEPAQYIRGKVDFFDCSITVNPGVLIPRQETEILVDKIAKELAQLDLKGKVLWDLCCGSGCIGIALKKKFPDLAVELSDVSKEALQIAHQNAQTNHVDVVCHQGDLLSPFEGRRTDFVVCNPPYIAEREFADLDIEVRDHEPRQSLISGPTDLEFYERLAKDLPRFLQPGGKVWLETGTRQAEPLRRLFSGTPWKVARAEKDWAGHDRFFFLEIE